MRRLAFVLLVGLAIGCHPAAEPTAEPTTGSTADPQAENDAARAGIVATNQKFSDAVAAGDVDGVRAVYTADATVMPPNAPTVSGADAIAEMFGGLMADGIDGLELEAGEVEAHGDTAHEVGRFTLSADGQAVDNGKYIVIWKRGDDGMWRLHRDIFNSDNPVAGADAEGDGDG